jgi:hypothetical protein
MAGILSSKYKLHPPNNRASWRPGSQAATADIARARIYHTLAKGHHVGLDLTVEEIPPSRLYLDPESVILDDPPGEGHMEKEWKAAMAFKMHGAPNKPAWRPTHPCRYNDSLNNRRGQRLGGGNLEKLEGWTDGSWHAG